MVVYWWTVVFGWQALQNWNLILFMFVLTYGLVLYLLSVILFPTDMPENWEPGTHIIRKRHWFYGVFLALVVIEFLDSYLKGHLDDFSAPYYVLMTAWATGGILAWTSRKKRVHDIVAIIVVASQVVWVSYQLSDLEWSLAGRIRGRPRRARSRAARRFAARRSCQSRRSAPSGGPHRHG